jgi:hypothetical protein
VCFWLVSVYKNVKSNNRLQRSLCSGYNNYSVFQINLICIWFVIHGNSLYITLKTYVNSCTTNCSITAGTDFLELYVGCSAVVPEF